MRTYLYDDIPTEQWEIILQDKNIITDKMKMIISLLYQAPDYTLNAGAMTVIMGYTLHSPLNSIVGPCGRKIKEQYNIPNPPDYTGHWLVVFNGEEELKNKFNWILKPNMIEAINRLQLLENDVIFSSMLQKDVEARQSITFEISNEPATAGERAVLAKARVGQGLFRAQLMEKYNGACCLCGLSIPQVLVASHIKPWAHSNPIEKADKNNGLLLCRNHDALFDQYLISFDTNGHILIHETINRADYRKLALEETMQIGLEKAMKGYMKAHRKVFEAELHKMRY